MKLNLSPSQASAMAGLMPVHTSTAPDSIITAALKAMRASGHAPFTRRDVFAVIAASAHPVDVDTLKQAWRKTPSFPRVKSAGRGYLDYPPSLGGRLATLDATAPAPRPIWTAAQLGDMNVVSRAGVVFVPASPDLDETTVYDHDTGLAQMAAQATPCFGLYEAGNKTCGGCPLRGSCAPATYSRIAEIARDLDAAVQATLAAAAKQAEAEATPGGDEDETAPTEPSAEAPTSTDAVIVNGGVSRVAPFDAPCTSCGIIIPAGDTGTHLPEEGYFHEACASAYVSA